MLEEKRNKHSVARTAYHIVWIPKYRRQILVGPVKKVLIGALEEKAGGTGVEDSCFRGHARPRAPLHTGG